VMYVCYKVMYVCYKVMYVCYKVMYVCYKVMYVCYKVMYVCYKVMYVCYKDKCVFTACAYPPWAPSTEAKIKNTYTVPCGGIHKTIWHHSSDPIHTCGRWYRRREVLSVVRGTRLCDARDGPKNHTYSLSSSPFSFICSIPSVFSSGGRNSSSDAVFHANPVCLLWYFKGGWRVGVML